MKINLIYSLLPLYFTEKIKAIEVKKKQVKVLAANNNSIEESISNKNRLTSSVNLEINETSAIKEKVKSDKTRVSSNKTNDINILLVEDNKTNQILISSLLQREKYQFDIVKNGWEAICAFEACKYDLILMDINMPVINGEEATKAIRKTNKQIPIIALTADDICDELFEDKLYMGFNDVISKPFNNEIFMTTIRNLITLTKRSFPVESGFDKLTWAS